MGLSMMLACTGDERQSTIDNMQGRLNEVERRVKELYEQEFNFLIDEYKALDTTIARVKDIGKEMTLLQAYLQQFENQKDVIINDLKYSREQLSNLKDDIKNKIYDDETTSKFIQDEEKVLHQMESKLDYFKEKLTDQIDVVKQLKNN